MATKRQVSEAFFDTNPVFSLKEYAESQDKGGNVAAARNQLKHYVNRGRVASVARGLYAAVPHGVAARDLHPDKFLVAAAARPDAVFCYHSALELLGLGHTVWNECTVFTDSRRSPIELKQSTVRFLQTPTPIRELATQRLGVNSLDHEGRALRLTSVERTLVEGFRRLHHVGGPAELIESVTGSAFLDFKLLTRVLETYDERSLWAVVGWCVEGEATRWLPPSGFLDRCRKNRPLSPHYLVRGKRGGKLLSAWNLIVPEFLARGHETHVAGA